MNELAELETRIKAKIDLVEQRMEKSNHREERDRFWTQIETLGWVLSEILLLSRGS